MIGNGLPVQIELSPGQMNDAPMAELLLNSKGDVNATDARFYLFDEWDANLDAANKAKADALVDTLAARARVVEISHRDRGK